MNNTPSVSAGPQPRHRPRKLSRDTVFLVGDLLPLIDFTGILLAAWLAALAYTNWIAPGAGVSGVWDEVGRAALAAAVLAPLILCERAYVSYASRGQIAALIRCYAVRFLMFASVVAAIGLSSRSLASLPETWAALWFASSLLVTAVTRWMLVATLRRLERKGILRETIAVVGAGPVADRLIQHLRQTRGRSVEILGVFDDGLVPRDGCLHAPAGSVADLVEIGKTRPMDWIVLTRPDTDERELESIVHRLKTLAVPVGLCQQDFGLAIPGKPHRYAGDGLPATLLADRPDTPWNSWLAVMETMLPRWIITLLSLPLEMLRLAAQAPHGIGPRYTRPHQS